ncbi:MAG TPA: hybrid sensor histidine kinase/response regulator [Spirochaetota bacterium]|nr:hybrid sensor histidine kinase/response regulator [Spirochaetota bacterium]
MNSNKLDKIIEETRKELSLISKAEKNQEKKQKNYCEETIMVVDDDTNIIKSLEFIFKEKYRVITCSNSLNALKKFSRNRNDIMVILLDIKMDGKDGIELYKEFKKINPVIPIVFNTAYPGEYKVMELVQTLHPFGYIVKGSDPQILYDNLDSAIAHYKLTKEKDLLNEKLQRTVDNLKKLQQSSQKISCFLDEGKIYKESVKQFKFISRCDYALSFQTGKASPELICKDPAKSKKTDKLLPLAQALIIEVKKKKKVIIINQATPQQKIKRIFKNRSLPANVKNIAAFPVRNHKTIHNIIVIINSKLENFNTDITHFLLAAFSNQISISLKNIALINAKIKDNELLTIGRTAGTIVHDLNSPLTVIRANLQLLEQSKGTDKQKFINNIKNETERIIYMIKELSDFIHTGTNRLKKSTFDPNEVIADYCALIRDSLKKDRIRLRANYKYKGNIHGDKQKIIRVLQNILNNAREAVSPPGTISITTARQENRVMIKIHNDGPAMSKKIKKNIFQPFYSKKAKKSLGLGLYIVQEIIKQHQGYINIESSKGKGTAFIIYLPLKV